MNPNHLPLIFTETLYCFSDAQVVPAENEELTGQILIASKLGEEAKKLPLLQKILKAVQIETSTSHFITIEQFDQFLSDESCHQNKFICFNDKQEENYTIQSINKNQVLHSVDLSILENSVEDKKKLWKAMQELF